MKKRLRTWIIRLTATFLLMAVILVVIILYPALTYANKTVHGHYTVFHRQPLHPTFTSHLDQAVELVRNSEYYDPQWKLDICLDDGAAYPSLIKKIWGRAFGRGFYNKVVLMEDTHYKENKVVLNGYAWNLEQLLAHEMIHCFQFHKRGLWKSKPMAAIPDWKWEGYAEYISRRNPDQRGLLQNAGRLLRPEARGDDWIRFADGSGTLVLYYRYWLMVQYCMDIKKMRYGQLIDDTLPEEAVWKQLMDWYGLQKRQHK